MISMKKLDISAILEANQAANTHLYQAPTEVDIDDDEEDDEIDDKVRPQLPPRDIEHCYYDGEQGDSSLYNHHNKGRFCKDLCQDTWFWYNSAQWVCDLESRSLQEGFVPVISALMQWNGTLGEDRQKKIAKEFSQRIKKLKSLRYRQQIREMASLGAQGLGIHGDRWDRDPYQIACGNGTVNLSLKARNSFGSNSPADFHRRRTPIPYLYDARCEHFLKVLTDIFKFCEPMPNKEQVIAERRDEGDSEEQAVTYYNERYERWIYLRDNQHTQIISFLQVFFGMSLIGEVLEHLILILSGKGRNGKSLMVELLQYVLGDYAGTVQPEILLSAPRGRSSAAPAPDILDLQGRRLVFASETRESDAFDTATVKRLSGGDTLSARGLFAKHITTFRPSHQLCLLTNNKPNAPADDFAFWQRVILVPFDNVFVADPDPTKPNEMKQDPQLLNKLKSEAPGILAWLIEGAYLYQEYGLVIPEIIKDCVQNYREEVDLLGQFITDACMQVAQYRVAANTLYKGYCRWCEDNGCRALSNKKFGSRMKKRGYEEKRTNRGLYYLDLDLLDEFKPFGGY